MINITRTDCPQCLKDTPQRGSKYKDKKVVNSLWIMQNKKCCYCEDKIPENGHSRAVEHFRPQSKFKYLRNDWRNLLLACAQCNGKKSDNFPLKLTNNQNVEKVLYVDKVENCLLLDPSNLSINPEDHLDFIVDTKKDDLGLITARNNSNFGVVTIEVIGLYNPYYTGEHIDHILDVLLPCYRTLLKAHYQGEPEQYKRCIDDFQMYTSEKCKYAGLARAFVKHYKIDKRFKLKIN